MELSKNAKTVLEKRYYRKDEQGNVLEDWNAMITRIANNIAAGNEENYKKFYNLLDSGVFMPNSPTLMNAGTEIQQLSACFVLPIDDSMESIFNTVKNAALIHKSGGGTGFSFSRLRESNCRVKTTNGVSSGPISFLKVFNSATDAVKQGGTRRGANMAILSVNHPQILEFIKCKSDMNELTNFNISVGITKDFMNAVVNDKKYNLISPHTKKVHSKLKAKEVFELIIEMAYNNGEPGIVFLDRINEHNPTPQIGDIESTNPCGEQPLLPYEACNLGSINVLKAYKNEKIDWEYLKQIIHDSVDFLDGVIDQSRFPLKEIQDMVEANRKIGLGIMGWAELLYKLQIPYDSDDACSLAEELMEFIDYHGKERSMQLAKEKGPFPNFKGSIYANGKLKREKYKKEWKKLIADIKENGIRNATVTTIAPTGTISMICNTSGGIEPQFSHVFTKEVMDGEKLLYVNEIVVEAIKNLKMFDGKKNTEKLQKELIEKIIKKGSITDIEEIPDDLKKVLVVSHNIKPEWHIKMQAAFQKYTDNAVSKTINFPNHATKDDIKTAFELAWKLGCKGLTVYRDGSRQKQVLTVGEKSNENKNEKDDEGHIAPRIRPYITSGITQRYEMGCGHLYITINTDDIGPCEIFVQMGKVGGCASAQLESIARLTSLLLKANVQMKEIIKQLKGIGCKSPAWNKGKMITSCGDAIATSLETYLTLKEQGRINGSIHIDEISSYSNEKSSFKTTDTCPECGCELEQSEGCPKCRVCGYSKC